MQGGRIVPLCGGHLVHVHGVVKQGSDCQDAQEYVMRFGDDPHKGVACTGATATRPASLQACATSNAKVAAFCQVWTKPNWVQAHPGRGHSFA